MTRSRTWIEASLPPGAYDALAHGLPSSRLWSVLLEVAEARATRRAPADLVAQWDRDRFVQPALVDQRSAIDVDRHLLAAVSGFESIELSPVAPLGVCSGMGPTSQHKVVSTLRGTEVVSDPTNVLALECARRLRRERATTVRLATSHRCVRAQEIPQRRGHSAHFRIFCLATAAIERQNHAVLVAAVVDQIGSMLSALDRLELHGFSLPDRRITVLATTKRSELADRIVGLLDRPAKRAVLDHPYYNGGLRFQISARCNEGKDVPLIDGGAFDWVAKLTANRRAVYVASGMGSQLLPILFRREEPAART